MAKMSLREWRKPKQLELEAYIQKMMSKGLDENGHLMPDPTPIAPPIGYKKHPSMVELVRDMVRGERLRQEALAAGAETFEESEDFDVGDEPDLASSPFENEFDPPLGDLLAAGEAEIARKASETQNAVGEADTPKPVPSKAGRKVDRKVAENSPETE